MPTAFVTGASRGIGKAIAVHLARAGYDVAVTARTLNDGEGREHSSTVARSDTSPLPGSLTATAQLVRDAGQRCLIVQADLTDRASMIAAAQQVLKEWGPVDVLVNNGRYIGPGHMDKLMDTPLDLISTHVEANAIAPLALAKEFIPGMIERGAGVIVSITSGAGYHDPPAAAGEGGGGLGYGMSKGAMHRIAGILQLELGAKGIRAYNVQPGFIATERMAQDMGNFGFDSSAGAPPDVLGAVVTWIVTHPEAAEKRVEADARNFEAQDVCKEYNLLPGWPA
jgi:NAD(P)-dependent dehydrogenase (short-subunit alcohol dehydrogenase family)